jgi:hypothetical protein
MNRCDETTPPGRQPVDSAWRTRPGRLPDGEGHRGRVQHASGLELHEQPPVAALGQHRLKQQDRASMVPVDRAAGM